jgi:hypothetical protein
MHKVYLDNSVYNFSYLANHLCKLYLKILIYESITKIYNKDVT